jgi:Kef-type K+ transport system membrane component KefB
VTISTLFLVAVVAVLAPLLAEITPGGLLPVVVAEIALGILAGPVFGIATPDPVLNAFSGLGMAFLFFLAGAEIDLRKISGRPLMLGLLGWAVSLALAFAVAALFAATDVASPVIFVAGALATTALGTLMPILRDAGVLDTRLGTYVVAVGMCGELCPIVLISLLLGGSADQLFTAVLLVAFSALAVACALAAQRYRPRQFLELLDRHMHTTAQLPVRFCLLLLVSLVFIARDFGLDVILGAFAAGMVIGIATRPVDAPGVLQHKLEAIGFGFLIPIFFITSGLKFDLDGLTGDSGALALVPVFMLALLAVRGLPALLYRRDLGRRERIALGLYSATSLPIIVAVTAIATSDGRMRSETAAALVAAGMLSVLVFPALARTLSRPASSAMRAGDAPEIAFEA